MKSGREDPDSADNEGGEGGYSDGENLRGYLMQKGDNSKRKRTYEEYICGRPR